MRSKYLISALGLDADNLNHVGNLILKGLGRNGCDEKGLVYEAGAVHLLHSSAAFDCVQHSGKTSGAEVSITY